MKSCPMKSVPFYPFLHANCAETVILSAENLIFNMGFNLFFTLSIFVQYFVHFQLNFNFGEPISRGGGGGTNFLNTVSHGFA